MIGLFGKTFCAQNINRRWREFVLLSAMAVMVALTVVALLLATGAIG